MAFVLGLLKIVGVLFLFVLGFLLLALLLLLFVPFRYRVFGSYLKSVPDGTVSVSWLFHAVSLRVTYHHGAAVSGRFCIFGIPVRKIEGKPEMEKDSSDGAGNRTKNAASCEIVKEEK